ARRAIVVVRDGRRTRARTGIAGFHGGPVTAMRTPGDGASAPAGGPWTIAPGIAMMKPASRGSSGLGPLTAPVPGAGRDCPPWGCPSDVQRPTPARVQPGRGDHR